DLPLADRVHVGRTRPPAARAALRDVAGAGRRTALRRCRRVVRLAYPVCVAGVGVVAHAGARVAARLARRGGVHHLDSLAGVTGGAISVRQARDRWIVVTGALAPIDGAGVVIGNGDTSARQPPAIALRWAPGMHVRRRGADVVCTGLVPGLAVVDVHF